MKYALVSLVLAAVSAASTFAQAQGRGQDPTSSGIQATSPDSASTVTDASNASSKTVHAHDGFFLGLQFPIGYQHSTMVENTTVSGASAGFNLQLGGAVAPNFILFAEVGGTSASNPVISNGTDSTETKNLSSDNVGFGPGFAYYIMPLNVYVGGSVLLSSFELNANAEGEENLSIEKSSMGIGAVARAGKEFWVSDNWALGLGLEARFATMKFLSEQMTTGSYGVTLSGTYN